MTGRLWGDELKIGPFIMKTHKAGYNWPTQVPQPYNQDMAPWLQQQRITNNWVPLYCIFDSRDLGKQFSTGQGWDAWLPVCVCQDEASAAQVICALAMATSFEGGTLEEIKAYLQTMIPKPPELAPDELDKTAAAPVDANEVLTEAPYEEDKPRSVWDM